MKNKTRKLTSQLLLSVCLMGLYSLNIQAQIAPRSSNVEQSLPLLTLNITQEFAPRPSKSAQLSFENWDHFLSEIVLYTGPAVRKRAPKVTPSGGTRLILRDNSPYRYEGNKVVYTFMGRAEKKWLKEYVSDLEALSNETDITSLSKNDQLSYWYNLHNAAVISLIAQNYPVKFPERLKPIKGSSETFHDAKILNISGVPLSLRDIREKIVYPNWKNPLVIYGFHHGNLGGPSIALRAYERDTLLHTLSENADEFINSFRSYRRNKISPLYRDVIPYYFPNGESDIRAHFKRYMRPEVYAHVETYKTLRWHRPLPQTADVSGGVGFGNTPFVVATVGQGGNASLPAAFSEHANARRERIRIARQRGYLRNSVIIEDIETSDTDLSVPVN